MKSGYTLEMIICCSTPMLFCAAVTVPMYVWEHTGNQSVSLIVLSVMLAGAVVAMHLADRVLDLGNALIRAEMNRNSPPEPGQAESCT